MRFSKSYGRKYYYYSLIVVNIFVKVTEVADKTDFFIVTVCEQRPAKVTA